MSPTSTPCLVAAVTVLGCATAFAAPTICENKAAVPATIVELYTSEGCSSCPPADRWLSTLKARPDVLALAFHVNYWDRLGWPDRFASPEATARQHLLASAARSDNVYTPQVVVNGRDYRGWPTLAASKPAASASAIELVREGDQVTAKVAADKRPAQRVAGYWAVLEDAHQSQVRAGENAGETLKHDHVVRLYKPLAEWASDKPYTSQLRVSAGAAEHPRRAAFVLVDPVTQKPLQAATLTLPPGC